jgi:hypothetical protein
MFPITEGINVSIKKMFNKCFNDHLINVYYQREENLLNIYSHCDKVNIFIIKYLLNIYSHRDKVNMETFIKAKQI